MSISNTISNAVPGRITEITSKATHRISVYFKNNPNKVTTLRLLPALVWIGFLLGFSLILVTSFSFMAQRPAELTALLQPEYTVQNYIDFFRFPLYYTVLWDSFVIGIMVTILTLLLAYPIAYYLAFVAGDRKFLFMVLIILPFWINLVVRTFAWQLILSPRGLINYILYDLTSIFESRQNLAFSRNAIVVGLVHVFLPYMVIPIYTSLDRIDQSHVEAAKNLGANRIEAFYEVTLPQSLPGASAGVVMVFVLAFGSFVVPQLLGGAEDMMIANLIGGMFGQQNNWPLGAAMSVLFLATSLLLVYLFNRAVGLDELYGGEEGEA